MTAGQSMFTQAEHAPTLSKVHHGGICIRRLSDIAKPFQQVWHRFSHDALGITDDRTIQHFGKCRRKYAA
jgi:hypothetical protein